MIAHYSLKSESLSGDRGRPGSKEEQMDELEVEYRIYSLKEPSSRSSYLELIILSVVHLSEFEQTI